MNDQIIATPEKDNKNKFRHGGKHDGKHEHKNQIRSLKDIVTDPDPSHMRWRIKEGENFSKTFSSTVKNVQKPQTVKSYA
jgi:hypothetical protein